MELHFRSEPVAEDIKSIHYLLTENGIFRPREVHVAVELVQDRLMKGTSSEYLFIFADKGNALAGFVCYGEITVTVGSYDLYWIAVRNDSRGMGLGKELLRRAEKDAVSSGARAIFIETSSRSDYAPARRFYEKSGHNIVCIVHDFYDRGDHKIIFSKDLTG
jgi:ribosomal protein S18 acetylase RimI-like enzyme